MWRKGFGKFEDVTEDKRAEAVSARIISFFRGVWMHRQSCGTVFYDGAAVTASGINGGQAKVKETILCSFIAIHTPLIWWCHKVLVN